nr:hypothetical protein DEQ67_16625 [Haloferax sp. Atlit-48N]
MRRCPYRVIRTIFRHHLSFFNYLYWNIIISGEFVIVYRTFELEIDDFLLIVLQFVTQKYKIVILIS